MIGRSQAVAVFLLSFSIKIQSGYGQAVRRSIKFY